MMAQLNYGSMKNFENGDPQNDIFKVDLSYHKYFSDMLNKYERVYFQCL